MRFTAAIILIFTCIISAQDIRSVSDSLNIRAILSKQINDIKARDSIVFSKSSLTEGDIIVNTDKSNIKESLFKPFLLLESGLVAVLVVLWRRKRARDNKSVELKFKDNVRKLRMEKIGSTSGSKPGRFKEFINAEPIRMKNTGKDITVTAKKFDISKGEVHLAAKIKYLMDEANDK